MLRRYVWVGVLALLAVPVALGAPAESASTAKPGLTLGPGGQVLRRGEPYRGIGVNFFSAFSRTIEDPGDTSYRRGFETLAAKNIPFARVMWGGFYPKDWKLYLTDKPEYFARMDKVVKAAEETGVGLIPSLFFAYSFTGDLVGEPRSAWGDPSSKTQALMRQYVEEVVTRYKDSDAIWAWEFANEANLDVDLPNAAEHRPPILPHWGTPDSRSAADDMKHAMMVVTFREFGQAVRRYDPDRPITHGASLPRPAAEHLRTEGQWVQDSREEFQQALLNMSPDPIDLVSVHIYPFDGERFGEKGVKYAEILRLSEEACARAGKALFVGEFGSSDEMEGGPEAARKAFEDLLTAIEHSRTPLAALWVFDLPNQESTCNITAENARAHRLDAVGEVNRRIQGRSAR